MEKIDKIFGRKILLGCLLMALLAVQVSGQTLVPTRLTLNYDLSHIDTDLEPGDSGIMTLVIQNVGGQNAEKVEILIPDAGDIRISKRWYLGTIKAGEIRTISTKFSIAKDAKIGLHTATVNAKYDGYDRYGKIENDIRDTWEVNVNVVGESIFVVEDVTLDRVLKPGDTFHLKLSLRNKGIGTAFDTDAELNLVGLPINVIGPEKQYLGNIGKNGLKDAEFILYLDEDIATGAYSIPLVLNYEDMDHTPHTTTLPIGIKVIGDVQISLGITETDPKEIHAGDEDVEIKVKVDNLGTKDLKNVKVTFNPEFPFENPKSYIQMKDLGTLKASGSSEISFYANINEDARPGRIGQIFYVEYRVDNREENITVKIPIDIMEYPDFELVTDGIRARIGEYAELRLKVKNTGSRCDSVTVWALKKSGQPFDFEDKSEFVGDLDTDEEGEAVLGFTVEGDAKVKEYILPIEIRCTRDNDVLTFSKSAKIDVVPGRRSNIMAYLVGVVVILLILFGIYKFKRGRKSERE